MFTLKENDKIFKESVLKQICHSSKYLAYIDPNKYDLITLQDMVNRNNNMSMLEMPIYLSKYAIKCCLSMLEGYFPKMRKYIKSENISVDIEPDEKMYIMEHGKSKALNNIFFIVAKNIALNALSTSIGDLKEKIFKDAIENNRRLTEKENESTRQTTDASLRENYNFPRPNSSSAGVAVSEEYTNALTPELNFTAAAAAAEDAIERSSNILSFVSVCSKNRAASVAPSCHTVSIIVDKNPVRRKRSVASSVTSDLENARKRQKIDVEIQQQPLQERLPLEQQEEQQLSLEEQQEQQIPLEEQQEQPPLEEQQCSILDTLQQPINADNNYNDDDDKTSVSSISSYQSSCFTSVSQRPVNDDKDNDGNRPSNSIKIDPTLQMKSNRFSSNDFLDILGKKLTLSPPPTPQAKELVVPVAPPSSPVDNNNDSRNSSLDDLLNNVIFR